MIPGLTEIGTLWLLCGGASAICAAVAMLSRQRKRAIDFPKVLAVTAGYLLTLLYCIGYVIEQFQAVEDGKAKAVAVFLPIAGIAILGWFCVLGLQELLSPPVKPEAPKV